jgi:hypothetical protein
MRNHITGSWSTSGAPGAEQVPESGGRSIGAERSARSALLPDGQPGPGKVVAVHDRLQGPFWAAGVVAESVGDAGVAGQPQDGDGENSQGGHDPWGAGSADLGTGGLVALDGEKVGVVAAEVRDWRDHEWSCSSRSGGTGGPKACRSGSWPGSIMCTGVRCGRRWRVGFRRRGRSIRSGRGRRSARMRR